MWNVIKKVGMPKESMWCLVTMTEPGGIHDVREAFYDSYKGEFELPLFETRNRWWVIAWTKRPEGYTDADRNKYKPYKEE